MLTHLGAALIGLSGALMLTAGTALPHGWATARPFILSGGLAVQAAFLLQRRATSQPRVTTGSSLSTQGAASAAILLAGAALVAIGYQATHDGWWPISITTPIPIAAAIAASVLNYRAAAIRLAHQGDQAKPSCTRNVIPTNWIRTQPSRVDDADPPSATSTEPDKAPTENSQELVAGVQLEAFRRVNQRSVIGTPRRRQETTDLPTSGKGSTFSPRRMNAVADAAESGPEVAP